MSTNVPAAINAAKVYIDGSNEVTGIAEVTLPELKFMVAEIEGFDIAGKIEEPIIGSTDVMDLVMKFSAINGDISNINDQQAHTFHLRAAQQHINSATGNAVLKGLKVDIKGKVKEFKGGTVKAGEKTETEIVISCLAYKVTLDGKEIINIDKLGFKSSINGIDQAKRFQSLLS